MVFQYAVVNWAWSSTHHHARSLLSLTESAEYFGIGYKKLAKFVDEHKDEKFILWNGTRAQIKRVMFEQYVNEHMDAI